MSPSNSPSPAGSGSSSTSKTGFLKREDLLGKPVVGQDAMIVGTVKDLAVAVDGKVAIQVEKKHADPSGDSQDVVVGSDEIIAVGDFVLLRGPRTGLSMDSGPDQKLGVPPPPFPSSSQAKVCPKCSFANAQTSRFCVKCGSLLR
ncbi:MAG: PRC-barrel domain-containing protein [Nitrososphaerales archaeon]